MPTAEKAVKEKDCTQMPAAKKERTDHKYLWQRKKDKTTNAGGKRKMAALIRKWPIQLTPNERKKTAETTQKHQSMTKHRDVNKCRLQEKYKMAALIRQANKRVRNGQ